MMKADEVRDSWREFVLPYVVEKYEQDGVADVIARRESFNDYCDSLCKDRQISEHLYDIIAYPKECERR